MRVFYAKAIYGAEEVAAVTDVLQNHPLELMGGPIVSTFEARIAALFGKRHGLLVNSGSSANLLAFAALDLPRGSEVITPALTFSTTVAPLVQHGLVPAFVDVEPDTYVIDAARVEEMVGPKTRAMMIPNLIGNLPDWTALHAIAERHGLLLVEDSCDTVGYQYRGGTTGELTDATVTSFYASHVMTCAGFGGLVAFNDPALERRARLLRGWGRSSSLLAESERIEDRFGVETDGVPYDNKFVFEGIGYNFQPSALAAAFGLVQLGRLSGFIEARIRNFARLHELFTSYARWFVLPRQRADARTAWLAFPLIVRDDAPFRRRDLQEHLETLGIQTRTVFTGNILRQPGFRNIERRDHPAGYANADQVMRGGMLLGCHQGMDDEQLAYMLDALRQFMERW
jgi:CDP-6-deoxy-D-xylo-4-hexulose-3-dehydrase